MKSLVLAAAFALLCSCASEPALAAPPAPIAHAVAAAKPDARDARISVLTAQNAQLRAQLQVQADRMTKVVADLSAQRNDFAAKYQDGLVVAHVQAEIEQEHAAQAATAPAPPK